MQPRGLEQVLVHGWELAFKLHRPHSLMLCTWRSTEGTGMSSGAMTYYCISQTNRRQAQSTTKPPNLCLLFYLISYLFASLFSKVWAMIWSHVFIWITRAKVTKCVFFCILTIQVLLYVIWFLPWPTQAWQVVLYDRLGQRLRTTCYIPLRGVSWMFIDQNGPISTPITYIWSGWVILEKTTRLIVDFLPSCPAIWGQKPRNALKSLNIRK